LTQSSFQLSVNKRPPEAKQKEIQSNCLFLRPVK